MNSFDAWAMAPDDYSQWENIAVAVLFVLAMTWLFLVSPAIGSIATGDGSQQNTPGDCQGLR